MKLTSKRQTPSVKFEMFIQDSSTGWFRLSSRLRRRVFVFFPTHEKKKKKI